MNCKYKFACGIGNESDAVKILRLSESLGYTMGGTPYRPNKAFCTNINNHSDTVGFAIRSMKYQPTLLIDYDFDFLQILLSTSENQIGDKNIVFLNRPNGVTRSSDLGKFVIVSGPMSPFTPSPTYSSTLDSTIVRERDRDTSDGYIYIQPLPGISYDTSFSKKGLKIRARDVRVATLDELLSLKASGNIPSNSIKADKILTIGTLGWKIIINENELYFKQYKVDIEELEDKFFYFDAINGDEFAKWNINLDMNARFIVITIGGESNHCSLNEIKLALDAYGKFNSKEEEKTLVEGLT